MTPPSLDDTQPRLQASFVIPRNIVALPSWLAAGFLVVFVLSVAASFVLFFQAKGVEDRARDRDRLMEREIKILAIHIQDSENVLIRQGIAKRDDFAPWQPTPPKPSEGE